MSLISTAEGVNEGGKVIPAAGGHGGFAGLRFTRQPFSSVCGMGTAIESDVLGSTQRVKTSCG